MQNWFGLQRSCEWKKRCTRRDDSCAPVFPVGAWSGSQMKTTILNFRRLLEKHELAAGILAA
nr:hypothetical protein [Pseudomonas fragi]